MIAPLSARARFGRFTPGNCIVDCNGAQLRAHRRDQLTVVQVAGEIDATNIDRFYDYASRFVGAAPGLILDLSGVDFLCARGISVLIMLGDDCRAAGTRWAIVVSPFVRRLLQLGAAGDTLPTSISERQASDSLAAQPRRAHNDPDSPTPTGRIRPTAGLRRRITTLVPGRSPRTIEFACPPEELAATP